MLMTDTTVSEILARGEVSRMQSALDELIAWSNKTKEMILGSLSKQRPSLILDHNVEQVSSYKPLGITINNSLKWDDHITAVQDS